MTTSVPNYGEIEDWEDDDPLQDLYWDWEQGYIYDEWQERAEADALSLAFRRERRRFMRRAERQWSNRRRNARNGGRKPTRFSCQRVIEIAVQLLVAA